MFFNRPLKVFRDIAHSKNEERFAALGETNEGRKLCVVFAIRARRIRVISARSQNLIMKTKKGIFGPAGI